MSEIVSREIRLKQRPVGMPKESDFEIAEVAIAAPKAGEVLVRNIYMSVDPYMRGVVRNVALGVPLEGGCVGQVVQSESESFQVGDYVLGGLGWREYYLAPAQNVSQIDPTLAPIQSFVSVPSVCPDALPILGYSTSANPKREKWYLSPLPPVRLARLSVRLPRSRGVVWLLVLARIRR